MNLAIKNIKERRSIRKYTDKTVSKEIINEILDSAIYAPSSHNMQPWNFTIITDRRLIDGLSADIRAWYNSITKLSAPLYFIKEVKESVEEMRKRVKSEKDLFFYNAPAVVIIHAPKKRFSLQDCSCAAQNMMLAARSLGIGSCWIGFADIALNKNRRIRKRLGIPFSHRVMSTLVFGYPEKFPSKALPRREPNIDWIV